MSVNKKRIEIRVDEEEFEKLKTISRKQGMPVAKVVRNAISLLYLKVTDEDRKKAVEDLVSLRIDMPSWGKIEEDILKRYNDR